MTHSPTSSSPLQALAIYWQIWGLIAVAMGRQVSLLKKMSAQEAGIKAEILEAWLYRALAQLAGEIAAQSDAGPLNAAEADALEYLKSVYFNLLQLALLMSQIRRDMMSADFGWQRLRAYARTPVVLAPAAPAEEPPYIDTS